MITEAQYLTLTGVTAGADFDAEVAYVVERLEQALGRGIESKERTETVSFYSDGAAYVFATPVTGFDGSFDNIALMLGARAAGRTEVTYTGGWAPFDTAVAGVPALPAALATAIAFAVKTTTTPQAALPIPDGVASLGIAGEYSVNRSGLSDVLGADGVSCPVTLASIRDLGGRCAQLVAPYRRAR